MKNGRINNMQRKIFATLAQEVLTEKIEQARDESGERVAQITAQVKKELGIDTLDNKIKALETHIERLKEQRESLGFSRYSTNLVTPGSQAKTLIDSRTSTASQKICDLQAKRTEYIARIWASTALDEAMGVLDEVRKL